jgi:hypothetical protein
MPEANAAVHRSDPYLTYQDCLESLAVEMRNDLESPSTDLLASAFSVEHNAKTGGPSTSGQDDDGPTRRGLPVRCSSPSPPEAAGSSGFGACGWSAARMAGTLIRAVPHRPTHTRPATRHLPRMFQPLQHHDGWNIRGRGWVA